MMTKTEAPRLTAAQVILLAAADLGGEFTEWDLTVAAWIRDRNRFGLRGYAQEHPDHKRMYMEIAGKKPHNPLVLGFMVKVGPNVYRVTERGREEAERLRNGGRKKVATATAPPISGVNGAWLVRMEDLYADNQAARDALPNLWHHLCRNPKVSTIGWEFVAGEWVQPGGRS